MKLGKRAQVRILDDFAPDLAARIVAKYGMPLLVATYKAQGKGGLDLFVRCAMGLLGADTSEIDAVTMLVEQTVKESVLIPAGVPSGESWDIYLPE
jgi:hypothetical protein